MCMLDLCFLVFFFFKQKTAYEVRISYWSSDVCSSDLPAFDSGATCSASPSPKTSSPWSKDGSCYDALSLFRFSSTAQCRPSQRASLAHQHGFAEMEFYCRRYTHEKAAFIPRPPRQPDRKSVVQGKSVLGRVDLGGRRLTKKKKKQ